MTKKELITELADECSISQARADEYFKKLIHIVRSNLQAGRHVRLEGLGRLEVHHCKAHPGFDPSRRKKIAVAAKNRVKFKASLSLKEAVNGSR